MSAESCIEITAKSRTFKRFTFCGNIYITIVYKPDIPDRVDYVIIDGKNRENDCGRVWLGIMGDSATFCIKRIRNKHEAELVTKIFSHHRCNKYVPNKDHFMSCGDALASVLKEVLHLPEEDEKA